MAEEFYFNPFDSAFRADPYPFYKPLYVGPPRLGLTVVASAYL
jgi:hypothetical protein